MKPRPPVHSPPPRNVTVARAELVLAGDSTRGVRRLPLKPDPLTGIARALQAVDVDAGESASVVVDLLPLSPRAQQRHRRQQVQRMAHSRAASSLIDQVLLGVGHARRSRPASLPGPDPQLRAKQKAILDGGPLFAVQILLRCASPRAGLAEAHLQALLAAWEAWADDNWFIVYGWSLGPAFIGSDSWPRRRSFDRRIDTGEFAPPRSTVLSTAELRGWLKPPTRHCPVPGVIANDTAMPLAPAGLPTFSPDRADLLPLGRARDPRGTRVLGVPLADTYFGYMSGRSRFGKTEKALCDAIHLARSGHGVFFLDPHEDALHRLKPYLADMADRVVEISLSPRGVTQRQAAWNLLSMEGRPAHELEMRLAAIVDSFASALQWGEVNNRALTLTSMAAKALLELAQQVPPQLAPTIFQMTTLLANDAWRAQVLPFLSADSQAFWTTRFPRLAADAITPVTNLIDRLASSVAVKGLLGASRSTYDIRRCMDEGKIVLACPAGTGDKDRLVANFFVYDLLQAALSRRDTPPAARRRFFVFLDEVQIYDGASRGNLAALLEQTGKYGVVAFLLNQNPDRLTPATLDAIMTNRSHLATTAVNAKAAALLAREFGRQIDPAAISTLPRYHAVTSVTFQGEITPPFLVQGLTAEELFGSPASPDSVQQLDQTIDQTVRRSAITDTIAHLEHLDGAIIDWLQGRSPAPAGAPQRPVRGRASGLADEALVYDPEDSGT